MKRIIALNWDTTQTIVNDRRIITSIAKLPDSRKGDSQNPRFYLVHLEKKDTVTNMLIPASEAHKSLKFSKKTALSAWTRVKFKK